MGFCDRRRQPLAYEGEQKLRINNTRMKAQNKGRRISGKEGYPEKKNKKEQEKEVRNKQI